MHICTIRSRVIERPSNESITLLEGGFYEMQVEVPMGMASLSGDPKGYVKKEIARHLARCVEDTGVPLNNGLWNVAFTQWAQDNLNFPGGFTA